MRVEEWLLERARKYCYCYETSPSERGNYRNVAHPTNLATYVENSEGTGPFSEPQAINEESQLHLIPLAWTNSVLASLLKCALVWILERLLVALVYPRDTAWQILLLSHPNTLRTSESCSSQLEMWWDPYSTNRNKPLCKGNRSP